MDKKLLGAFLLAGVFVAVCVPGVTSQTSDDALPDYDAVGGTCNGTAGNGTIVLTPGPNATTCTITVPGNNSHYITLVFTRLSLQAQDSMTVRDGNDTVMSNVTGTVDSLVVVAFAAQASLVVHINNNNSTSVLTATYNTTDCSIEQTVSSRSVLKSPVYLPNKARFTCAYTLKRQQDATGSTLGLSFTELSLNNATLNVTSSSVGSTVTITGSSVPPDVYGNTDGTVAMVMDVPKSQQLQNFSAVVSPIASSSVCGQTKSINGSDALNITIPASAATEGYDCRVTLSASKGKSLWVNVTSVTLAGRGDSVEVIDGGALAGGKSLAFFSASSSQGYLVVSGQKQVMVRLALGVMTTDRNIAMDVRELDTVNHLYGSGSFEVAPPTGAANTTTAYFVLQADANSVVKFTLSKETANQTYDYTVSVHDGDQTSSPLLAVFSDSRRVDVVGSGGAVLVVVTLAKGSQPIKASFTSVTPGCDMVTSAAEGSFQLPTSSSLPAMCTWTITAPPAAMGTIMVDMATVKLSSNASVSVYSGLGGSASLVARLTMKDTLPSASPLPAVALLASQWAQVVWMSGNTTDVKSLAVNIRYQTLDNLCGGQVKATEGHLRSPSFPNLYPLNTLCQWSFPPPPSPPNTTNTTTPTVLVFDFPQFQLAPDHFVNISTMVNGTSKQMASLTGVDPLPDVVMATKGSSSVVFSAQRPKSVSVSNRVDQGFDIRYWTLACGGVSTTPNASFTTPGFPAQVPVVPGANRTVCVWMVRLPEKTGKDVNIVNVTLQFNSTGSPNVTKVVKVYDGDTLRHGLLTFNMSQTEAGGKVMNVNALSRYNAVMVVFNTSTPAAANAKASTVSLRVSYTTYGCNSSQLCNNGVCMHPDWRCNGVDDCGDNTDEQGCGIGPTPTPTPPKPAASTGTKAGIVVLLFFVGLLLGVLLTAIIPRIIRRFRTNRYTSFRDEPPIA